MFYLWIVPRMDRRSYIGLSVGTIATLAGCLGGSDDDESENGEETTDEGENGEENGGDESGGDWVLARADEGRSGYNPDEPGFEEGFETAWTVRSGDRSGRPRTVVHDGTVYSYLSQLRAFDADGNEIWVSDESVASELAFVDDRLVFINDNERLIHVDPDSGDRLEAMSLENQIASRPRLIEGNVQMAPDGIYVEDQRRTSTIEKYSIDTGELDWQSEEISEGFAITDDVLVVEGPSDQLFGVDRENGETVWDIELHANIHMARDGVVYCLPSSHRGEELIYAVDASDGSIQWEADGDYNRIVSIDDELVYASDEDVLHAIETDSGERRWEYIAPHWIGDGIVTDSTIVFHGGGGTFEAGLTQVRLGPDAEQIGSKFTTDQYTDSTNLLAADDTIYLTTQDLRALRPESVVDED